MYFYIYIIGMYWIGRVALSLSLFDSVRYDAIHSLTLAHTHHHTQFMFRLVYGLAISSAFLYRCMFVAKRAEKREIFGVKHNRGGNVLRKFFFSYGRCSLLSTSLLDGFLFSFDFVFFFCIFYMRFSNTWNGHKYYMQYMHNFRAIFSTFLLR